MRTLLDKPYKEKSTEGGVVGVTVFKENSRRSRQRQSVAMPRGFRSAPLTYWRYWGGSPNTWFPTKLINNLI